MIGVWVAGRLEGGQSQGISRRGISSYRIESQRRFLVSQWWRLIASRNSISADVEQRNSTSTAGLPFDLKENNFTTFHTREGKG